MTRPGRRDAHPGITPKTAVLNFYGAHVAGSRPAGFPVPARALIQVCQDLGLAEHATRSTLKRMVHSHLLRREPSGRTVSYALTDRAEAVLADGVRRVSRSRTIAPADAETWTLVAFSLPDVHQHLRHAIRSRLQWSGFGLLHSGLWIAPGDADVSGLDELDASRFLQVFTASPRSLSSIVDVADAVWDLPTIADSYRAFGARWSAGPDAHANELATELAVTSDWLAIISRDPWLPRSILPADWPREPAASVFGQIIAEVRPGAVRRAQHLIDSFG